jgi:hypothetical protein
MFGTTGWRKSGEIAVQVEGCGENLAVRSLDLEGSSDGVAYERAPLPDRVFRGG